MNMDSNGRKRIWKRVRFWGGMVVVVVVMILAFLAGCATHTARQVSSLRGYRSPRDYAKMDDSFAAIDRIAKKHLRLGMIPADVHCVMGEPEMKMKCYDRVELWTYLRSISGTYQYIVGFLDGKLEYFGVANPQWMGDDNYSLTGAERLLQVMKEEEEQRRSPN